MAVVALAAIMVLPGGALTTASAVHAAVQARGGVAGAVLAPTSAVAVAPLGAANAGMPGTGAAELQSATQSLQLGEGPAQGIPLTCSSPGASTATTCSGRVQSIPSGSASLPGLAPASAPNAIGSGLSWNVQGVPQPVGYIQYAMAWDYYDNYVVLFGGSSEGPYYDVYGGATWVYQSGVWTQLYPLTAPEGRDSSGLAYSPWDDAVVLFGGYYPGTGGYLNDTWLFKAGSWTQLHINSPSPRNGFGLVYDPAVDADVLFGGASPQCPENVCNDTWEFHYDTWTHVTGVAPPQRWQMSMAYDGSDGNVILFGGLGVGSTCLSGGACGDTWQWNGTAGWVQVPTNVTCGTAAEGPCPAGDAPSPRHEASMSYDWGDGYVLLFGGWNASNGQLGDTWRYSAGTWTQLAPSVSPTGRSGAGLTFDFSPGDGFLLMVGGTEASYTSPDAIWAWNAGAWFRTAPPSSLSPGPTQAGSMVYDPADGYVVFFGGFGPSFSLSDATWTYRHGVWTQLLIAGPPPDWYAQMAYFPLEGYVLLFGGANGLNWTWAFHGGSWTELCASTCAYGFPAPSSRYGAGLAFDPGSGDMILFGGSAYQGPTLGWQLVSETWAWFPVSVTSGYWLNYTTFLGSSVPAPRIYPGMTYDAHDNEIVLYGGGNGSAVFGDTWTMNDLFSGWSEVGSCGGPGQGSCSGGPDPSAAMIFDYDSVTQAVVMSGGAGGNPYYGYLNWQTYFFQGGIWTQCGSYTCDGYYEGIATFNGWGASAFDAADGYTVTEGGVGWYYNYYNGVGTYYQIPYSWVLGTPLFSQGPGFSPWAVDAGQSVTFSVGSTGGGAGAYSYSWNGLPSGCAPSSPTVATFTCVIENNGFTQYGATLEAPNSYFDPSVEVSDTSGSPSSASPDSEYWLGSLSVAPDPWVTIGSSTTVADVGQTVYFGLNVTYGWGPYTDTWSGLPPGCVLTVTGPSSERETCVLTSADVGTWHAQARSVDSTSYSTLSQVLQLTVDAAPGASAVSANTGSLDAGQTLSVWVTASGGEGSYSYAWSGVPAACLSDAAVLSCAVPASEIGAYTPSVQITDGLGRTVVSTYSGTITVAPVPTATSLVVTNVSSDPVDAIDAGLAVTFTLTSTPGSGTDTVAWSGLPSGCSPANSNSTSVSCASTGAGTYSVTATVTDANGVAATSPAAALEIFPALSGGAVSASSHTLDVGQALTVSASFVGGGGGLTYVWSGLPAGCVGANAPSVTCAPASAGRFTPSARVTDPTGGSSLATLASAIVVAAGPTATALKVVNGASVPVGSVTTGTLVTFELTATPGSGADTVSWSGLPAGCAPPGSNASSVACRPNATGTYTVSATEVDSNGVAVTSPVASLVVTSPAAATPFATPVEETQLGMLAALIALGAVAVVLALRRPPRVPVPPPAGPPPGPASTPPGPATGGGPSWKES